MQTIIIESSKYMIILFMLIYTFECFSVFRHASEEARKHIYLRQNIWMFFIQTLSYLVLILVKQDIRIILFYLVQIIICAAIIAVYRTIYPRANRLILNNMCMLLTIGFIILTRISYAKALRQFSIATLSLAIGLLVPYFFKKIKFFDKLTLGFAIVGIASLLLVLVFSRVINGSKINISVLGLTFQPSEIIKITFIFAIAGLLARSTEFKDIIISAAVAGIHVIILVLSKDLGSAVLFFMVYFAMLYVATRKLYYYLFGFLAGGICSVIGYYLFSHVRVRVRAFLDPLETIENAGYQVSQSLFAIGSGGYFGMGIGQGAPSNIPVVEADFIFSAICEEFGVIFGICLILICVSCLVMFLNIAMRFDSVYYKLIAVGIAVTYGFQVFLTIGGVTKFIPLTGVTLPLVSYGGSSVLVSIIMFSIIQGMYISVREQ